MFKALVMRLMGSRMARRWLSIFPLDDRTAILWQLWRSLVAGLDYRQRYLFAKSTFHSRRMDLYSLLPSTELSRVYGFFRLVECLRGVEGEIVECGVGRGITLAYLVYANAFFQLHKAVYGFDSFSGFPPSNTADLGPRVKTVNQVPEGWTDTSPELVQEIFNQDRARSGGLLTKNSDRLELVPGFFNQTLPGNLPEKIAFLHSDADMYDSTRAILDNCLPRMATGGVVVFDEYHDENWPGVKQAVDEICEARGLKIEYFEGVQRYGLKM